MMKTCFGFTAALLSLIGITQGQDLYVSSSLTNSVLKYNSTGAFLSAFVPAGSGGLNAPQGLAFGPDGNLYVSGAGSVLRYNGNTGAFLSTFVPTGTTGCPAWNARLIQVSGLRAFEAL